MADNNEFCEQIGVALVNLGTKEALSCMARMMSAIAHKQDTDIEFECDLATVTIERQKIHLDG
jgi:hypothetical protein